MRIESRAIVAILLALGVSATLIILAWNEAKTSGHVTVEEANLLSVLGGAGIGAVAAYLGGAVTTTGKSTKPPDDTPVEPSEPQAPDER